MRRMFSEKQIDNQIEEKSREICLQEVTLNEVKLTKKYIEDNEYYQLIISFKPHFFPLRIKLTHKVSSEYIIIYADLSGADEILKSIDSDGVTAGIMQVDLNDEEVNDIILELNDGETFNVDDYKLEISLGVNMIGTYAY